MTSRAVMSAAVVSSQQIFTHPPKSALRLRTLRPTTQNRPLLTSFLPLRVYASYHFPRIGPDSLKKLIILAYITAQDG